MIKNLHMLPPAETMGQLYGYHFPPFITLAHTFNAPKQWQISPRKLSQHQLQYVITGAANYAFDENTYITKSGDLIYHAPNVTHAVSTVDAEPYVCLSIVFHFGPYDAPDLLSFGEYKYFSGIDNTPLANQLVALITTHQNQKTNSPMLCQGLLMQILAALSTHNDSRQETLIPQRTLSKLVLVRNYLSSHYVRNISHEELEQLSGLSRNYLISRFRENYGMTPFEMIVHFRVSKAKELAIQTSMSVGEIAVQVGYADITFPLSACLYDVRA